MLASHYKLDENEVKFGLSEPIRRTKSSIQKRVIVRRSVRRMCLEFEVILVPGPFGGR